MSPEVFHNCFKAASLEVRERKHAEWLHYVRRGYIIHLIHKYRIVYRVYNLCTTSFLEKNDNAEVKYGHGSLLSPLKKTNTNTSN